MKYNKHCPVLIAITYLFLAGCGNTEDQVFQVARCAIAAGTVDGTNPGEMGIKAGQAVARYIRGHGLDMSQDKIIDLGEKARKEIAGDPELPMPTQVDRAKQIMTSEFCKKNLS